MHGAQESGPVEAADLAARAGAVTDERGAVDGAGSEGRPGSAAPLWLVGMSLAARAARSAASIGSLGGLVIRMLDVYFYRFAGVIALPFP